MQDRERVLRLHQRLDAIEAELAQLAQQIGQTRDRTELDELKHRHNLAQAKANALQTLFDADFMTPNASAVSGNAQRSDSRTAGNT